MLSGFKQFILRGNVVDMAVGVVIGAAFGGVVKALTDDLLMRSSQRSWANRIFPPFISRLTGQRFLWAFHQRPGGVCLGGRSRLFLCRNPVNALIARNAQGPAPADPTTKKCPECLSEIPIDARRCAHCSQPVMGKAA